MRRRCRHAEAQKVRQRNIFHLPLVCLAQCPWALLAPFACPSKSSRNFRCRASAAIEGASTRHALSHAHKARRPCPACHQVYYHSAVPPKSIILESKPSYRSPRHLNVAHRARAPLKHRNARNSPRRARYRSVMAPNGAGNDDHQRNEAA